MRPYEKILDYINKDNKGFRNRPYKKEESYYIKVTITKTLIEDDELYEKIVKFAKNRYLKHVEDTLDSSKEFVPLTIDDLKNESRNMELFVIVDKTTRSGFKEEWQTSRWEDDYDFEPVFLNYKKINLAEIIKRFVRHHPKDLKWHTEETTKKVKNIKDEYDYDDEDDEED